MAVTSSSGVVILLISNERGRSLISLSSKAFWSSKAIVEFFSFYSPYRDPLQRPNKEILKVGDFLFFAANAMDGAAGISSGFLALMTEHRHDFPP